MGGQGAWSRGDKWTIKSRADPPIPSIRALPLWLLQRETLKCPARHFVLPAHQTGSGPTKWLPIAQSMSNITTLNVLLLLLTALVQYQFWTGNKRSGHFLNLKLWFGENPGKEWRGFNPLWVTELLLQSWMFVKCSSLTDSLCTALCTTSTFNQIDFRWRAVSVTASNYSLGYVIRCCFCCVIAAKVWEAFPQS